MRRKVIGGLLVAVATAALAGCADPKGVDGDLANGWPSLPEAKIGVPTAPACYSVTSADPTEVTRWPAAVECTASHTVETIHVGTFAGDEADRSTPPPIGGPGRRAAYEDCAARTKEFLGDDWRTSLVELFLVTPIALHWEAGARWYRCDVQVYADLEEKPVAERTESLKGQLAAASKLRLACVTVTTSADGKEVDTMLPVDCSAPHTGEFAGVWEAPDGIYPADATARSNANLAGCKGVVAAYVNVPNDGNFQYRTGQIATPFSKIQWELGNRGVRCYVWTGKPVSSSLKGVGVAGLPINYAG